MGSHRRSVLPHLVVVVVAGAEAGDHVTHLVLDADDVARGNFMFHQDDGSPRNLASLHLAHSIHSAFEVFLWIVVLFEVFCFYGNLVL